MRWVSGSRYDRSRAGRPEPRVGVALALTFAVVNACGGRTLENYEAESGGEGAEGGRGGSGGVAGTGGRSGTGAQGGTSGGSGGGTSVGGTGIGAGPGVTGGGPAAGGSAGKAPTGGVAGVAGTVPGTGGTSGAGGTGISGRGGSNSVGGAAGRAGGGRPGSGGRATGGSAGVSGRGGGGQAGAAGGGGSPAVYDACKRACASLPRGCDAGSPNGDCFSACPDLALGSPGCSLELADYLNCVATFLDPGAMCTVTPSGECSGQGCTAEALYYCSSTLDYYNQCQSGCALGYSVTNYDCSMDRSCPTHEHGSNCTLDASGGWYCTCSTDGVDAVKAFLYGDVGQVCFDAARYCDFVP
jgi:hypothetical protein